MFCVASGSGFPDGSSSRGTAIPDLTLFAAQPLIDLSMRQLENELPEPELARRQSPSLVPLDPFAELIVTGLLPQPLHGIPGAGGKDSSDDLLPVPLPPQLARVEVPEEAPDRRGQRIVAHAVILTVVSHSSGFLSHDPYIGFGITKYRAPKSAKASSGLVRKVWSRSGKSWMLSPSHRTS